MYLKYAKSSFIATISTITTVSASTTIAHPRLFLPIPLHLIQHAIIIRMIMSRRHHHNILLRQRLSKTTIIHRSSRSFSPSSNNGIGHSPILGQRDMYKCCVQSIQGPWLKLFELPFKPVDLRVFEPVVARVFTFVGSVFVGIQEPECDCN